MHMHFECFWCNHHAGFFDLRAFIILRQNSMVHQDKQLWFFTDAGMILTLTFMSDFWADFFGWFTASDYCNVAYLGMKIYIYENCPAYY